MFVIMVASTIFAVVIFLWSDSEAESAYEYKEEALYKFIST